ncbi:MAG TPA: hypothetical protein VGK53_00795 [Propionicimonas sp.]|jgi:hypothetical protein
MPRPWQRLAACTAAALFTLLLSGCEVHGTVDVKSGTQAEANLIFTEAEVDCLGLTRYAGLVIKGSPDSDGNQTCRAQGTIDLGVVKDFGITLNQTGEYLMLDLGMPQQYDYMPTKVDITFPGTVLDGGGSLVSGNSIQLTERALSAGPESSRVVVALSHAGPEWWVMALVAGFGGGVVLTVLLLLLVRRHRHLRATLQVDADQLPAPDATTPETGTTPPPATPDASPQEPVRDAAYEALFAPPQPGMVATRTRQPAQPPPPPETAVPADHEIWAPPEYRGDR